MTKPLKKQGYWLKKPKKAWKEPKKPKQWFWRPRSVSKLCFFFLFLQWFWLDVFVFLGFTMVLARLFTKTLVFHWFSLVFQWFSLVLLVFTTRMYGFLGFIMAILGSHLVLDWFVNGLGQVVLLPATVVPLSGPLRRGWREQPRNAPDAPELQKASKWLLLEAFRKAFRMGIG